MDPRILITGARVAQPSDHIALSSRPAVDPTDPNLTAAEKLPK